MTPRDDLEIAPVAPGEWPVLTWLWQAFREDLAPTVEGFPYADGRYNTREIADGPSEATSAFLAWRPHPKTGERAPVAFATVSAAPGETRMLSGFWVVPAARRDGVGRTLALHVLAGHPGPWRIGFQHANAEAGHFWRRVADEAFGAQGWVETRISVPRPGAPDDHLIESR
jgi:hypothetical protein